MATDPTPPLHINHQRRDPITGEWVIVAPGRTSRPSQTSARDSRRVSDDVPPFVIRCPFCVGNEHYIPPVLQQTPADGLPWLTRTVPNEYPALSMWSSSNGSAGRFFEAAPARGRHEVIVDHPYHDARLADMTDALLASVLQAYRARMENVHRRTSDLVPLLFRNYGRLAGASLQHPHAQLMAVDRLPPAIATRRLRAYDFFAARERCLFCDVVANERREGDRIVYDDGSVVAFVPFAARVPYEVWIMPVRHEGSFVGTTVDEMTGIARALRGVLHAYRYGLGDPPYNFHIEPAAKEPSAFVHYYLRVLPRLGSEGGFEKVSGSIINPSLPERDATDLRQMVLAARD
jgi:UDPglucose--hexose-1-phosphate uridylyltransferase